MGASNLVGADLWARAYAGDTKENVKWAMGVAGFTVLLFLMMGNLFGIYGKLLLQNVHPNAVVPELLKLFVPPGVFGLILAGFFAAIMSSADTMLLVLSTTIVHDLYQKTLGRTLTPEQTLWVGRWATFILGVLAVLVAVSAFSVVHLAFEAVSFHVALLPAVIFGFYWRRASSSAAFWSIVTGFVTIVIFLFVDPVIAFIPGVVVSFLTFFLVSALLCGEDAKSGQEVFWYGEDFLV